MSDAAIVLEGLTKEYKRGSEQVHALRGISLKIETGDFVSIVGHSGSGKTTLLQMMGCLDRPSSGKILIDGEEVNRLPDARLTKIRAEKIGFVFQQFFLIPTLTAVENVELPSLFSASKKPGASKARELLEQLGLKDRMNHRPSELSGGEMQRVAIARALINDPKILLADEPTGNLDSENAKKIMSIFTAFHGQGLTILMVTHNQDLAAKAERVIHIKDGLVHNLSEKI